MDPLREGRVRERARPVHVHAPHGVDLGTGRRGTVDHVMDPLDRSPGGVGVDEVAAENLDPFVRRRLRGLAHEGAHGNALLEEPLHDSTADEAGRSGHERRGTSVPAQPRVEPL